MLYHCDICQVADFILAPCPNYTCMKENLGMTLEHIYLGAWKNRKLKNGTDIETDGGNRNTQAIIT